MVSGEVLAFTVVLTWKGRRLSAWDQFLLHPLLATLVRIIELDQFSSFIKWEYGELPGLLE